MIDNASFVGGFARYILAHWKEGCRLRENMHMHMLYEGTWKKENTTRSFILAIYQLLVLFIFSF